MLRLCLLISTILVAVVTMASPSFTHHPQQLASVGALTDLGKNGVPDSDSAGRYAQAQDCLCSWKQPGQPGQAAQTQSGCVPQSQCQQNNGVCGGPCKGP